MKWLKKIIPGFIEIRSLYWMEYVGEMDRVLGVIYQKIDEDRYEEAQELINSFEGRFTQNGVPRWVALKYSEIYRAISMVNFLRSESIE